MSCVGDAQKTLAGFRVNRGEADMELCTAKLVNPPNLESQILDIGALLAMMVKRTGPAVFLLYDSWV